ncbi:MAG: PIN domain nuclease [Candidatus Methylomirabilota bacterium]|nr:PIN domain-containing protein [Candidatus Methylomirabilis sp.]NJD67582.1 PIN domain-containing protein [candidate division NC10 bacterium]PWB46579.1 MAG: PIN domain nuclease [candidate division NC10 bacterium]
MTGKVFVDTNVLIYAHDLDAGPKRAVAAAILEELWSTRLGLLSAQVLQEFYVNVTRKIPSPLSPVVAREIVRSYCAWPVQVLKPEMILRASEIEERHQLSFWDALIVTAALAGHAAKILSEDLQSGRMIEGITIEDPFASMGSRSA